MPGQKLTPEKPDAQARTSVPTFIRESNPPPLPSPPSAGGSARDTATSMNMTVDSDTLYRSTDRSHLRGHNRESCCSGFTTQCLDLGPNGAPEVTKIWQKIALTSE